MGKRRTNAPHRDRYAGNDSESEEGEEECPEPEPLQPEQIASIKTRKKLIAKRRGGTTNDNPGVGVFGALSRGTSGSDESDKPAASVFTGFKGFSAFKPSVEPPKPNTTTTANSIFTATSTTAPTTSVFSFSAQEKTAKPENGDSTTITAVKESNKLPETTTLSGIDSSEPLAESSNNITETEFNFINELNHVYEKHYGKTKRLLKLPAEVIGSGPESGDSADEGRRKKYGLVLAELNKHCAKWINKHVEEDPLIVMTPIFVDYFNYLILMENSFFPLKNTLKLTSKASVAFGNINGTATTGANSLFKASNGDTHSLNNIILSNNKNEANGHKAEISQKFNGFDSMADKENEEAEKDRKLSDSSKSFASMIGKASMPPISFAASEPTINPTVTTASFSFKPMESTKLAEKDANSGIQTSLFKFGADSIVSNKSSPNVGNTEIFGNVTSDEPKLGFKSPAVTQVGSLAPTFKFGSTTSNTSETSKPTNTEASNSIFGKPVESVPTIFGKKTTESSPSLFGKSTDTPVSTTTLFGTNKEPQTGSLFSKPTETTAIQNSGSSIFSSLNKPALEKDPEIEKQPISSAPTFSSLMNASVKTSGFTGFAGFGGISAPTFGKTTSAAPAATGEPAKPLFSFGASTGASNQPGGLFGAGTTGSTLFGSGSTFPAVASGGGGDGPEDEEEYVPPKPEVSDVKEEGAVFDKRMKLYYYSEKESKFIDRGIGNLYLKPINDGEATQLIIRADNKLANILLNVKLNKACPISKISAKDISYLCIPNPPIPGVDSKLPCKFLFKVKTEDDALELVEKLNEYKK